MGVNRRTITTGATSLARSLTGQQLAASQPEPTIDVATVDAARRIVENKRCSRQRASHGPMGPLLSRPISACRVAHRLDDEGAASSGRNARRPDDEVRDTRLVRVAKPAILVEIEVAQRSVASTPLRRWMLRRPRRGAECSPARKLVTRARLVRGAGRSKLAVIARCFMASR